MKKPIAPRCLGSPIRIGGWDVRAIVGVIPLGGRADASGFFFRHDYFDEGYNAGGFYGMDVEFKFDSTEGGESRLYVKQARPYPGWGS